MSIAAACAFVFGLLFGVICSFAVALFAGPWMGAISVPILQSWCIAAAFIFSAAVLLRRLPVSRPLVKSDALSDIENAIASKCWLNIINDHEAGSVSYTQGDINVCGMTVKQLANYMINNTDALIGFGIGFMNDEDSTSDEQEFPDGEEQDPDGESETEGYKNGLGIKVAIYHNFLGNRTPTESRVYRKNRRIPKHTKFAKELARVFAVSNAAPG